MPIGEVILPTGDEYTLRAGEMWVAKDERTGVWRYLKFIDEATDSVLFIDVLEETEEYRQVDMCPDRFVVNVIRGRIIPLPYILEDVQRAQYFEALNDD